MVQTSPIFTPQEPAGLRDSEAGGWMGFCGSTRRALVVAQHPLGIICALIQRGYAAAAAVRPTGKPTDDAYDLLLVPEASDMGPSEAIVQFANRWLIAGGRLVIGHIDPSARSILKSRLRLNGFIIVNAPAQHAVLVADRRRGVQ